MSGKFVKDVEQLKKMLDQYAKSKKNDVFSIEDSSILKAIDNLEEELSVEGVIENVDKKIEEHKLAGKVGEMADNLRDHDITFSFYINVPVKVEYYASYLGQDDDDNNKIAIEWDYDHYLEDETVEKELKKEKNQEVFKSKSQKFQKKVDEINSLIKQIADETRSTPSNVIDILVGNL